jgi:tubby-related protein 1
MITMDQEKISKKGNGYLGKVRSNFLGTEFCIYDAGANADKAKTPDAMRAQHGVIQYETNVLGSKGPRRMKVLLPMVDVHGQQTVWKSADVSELIQYPMSDLIFLLVAEKPIGTGAV